MRFAVAFFFLFACSSTPPDIVASDYNQTCVVDTDCITITVGGCCSCPNAAISASDQSKYQADDAKRVQACTSQPACETAQPCATIETHCYGGTCTTCQAGSCPSDDGGLDDAVADGTVSADGA